MVILSDLFTKYERLLSIWVGQCFLFVTVLRTLLGYLLGLTTFDEVMELGHRVRLDGAGGLLGGLLSPQLFFSLYRVA